jgi:hypothetical protein
MTNLCSREIAERFGFTSRYWRQLAAAGRIPGARQIGPKGHWLFDLDEFVRWWHSREQKKEPEWRPRPMRGGRGILDEEMRRIIRANTSGTSAREAETAAEAPFIGDPSNFCFLTKKSVPNNFGLLQQYRPKAEAIVSFVLAACFWILG